MIILSSVSKKYGEKEAVKKVSLRVETGEVLGLLGPNGAGKTTLLNMLTGFLAPTEGTITLEGHDICTEPREAKRLLGYLPESAPLYDEMTVVDYLKFVAALRLVVKEDIPAHVREIMKLTHLTDVAGRRIGNLSKGYRQRVGLAQALCGDPPVLVLDEPTSGLDPRQTVEFRELVRALAKGRTLIFSSHILSEVQEVCSRVVILDHGRIVFDQDIKKLGAGTGFKLSARICGEEKIVLPAVRSLPSVMAAERKPCDEKGQTEIVMTCRSGSEPEKELFTLLSGLEMPLMRLNRIEETLEKVFLSCTEE